MSAPRLIALASAAAAALLVASPAGAVYQCGPQKDDCQCGMSNPYPCCDNGGNCTWWAWEAACCTWAVGLPGWGNANQWGPNARANGNYAVNNWPVTSSVCTRASGTYGHVAWVTALNGGRSINVQEQNCWGNYGMRSWTYGDYGYFDGGFITRAGHVECQPGATQNQGCGRCGSQSRGCGNDGRWGGFGACGGEGPCTPDQTEDQPCGKCGTGARTCGGNCQWGPAATCSGEGACAAGEKQTEDCGNCGKKESVCSAACQWGEFGACAGEGVCAAGATEDVPCGDCGTQSRTCQATTCHWGSLGECVSHDPGKVEPCSTGLPGVCSAGTLQCSSGTSLCVQKRQPSAEVCNGLDDDCNGLTDEGLHCPDAGLGPGKHDAGISPISPISAGCGCASGGALGAGALVLSLLLGLAGLPRRG